MTEEEVVTIVTMRIEDCSSPAPGSKKGFVCNECGEPVWMHGTSIPLMEGKYQIACNRCVVDQLLVAKDPDVRAADPMLNELLQENPELKENLVGYMIARGLKSD